MRRTVFVSSTFQDLQTHRKAVWDVLGGFDVTVRGMEQFGARTGTPLQTCILEVDQSDIYVGIIAFRLGSIDTASSKSFTQLEYERALELSKEILIYLVDEENARVAVKFIDRGDSREKLDAFKRILKDRHTIDTFVDEKDLATKIKRDLAQHLTSRHSVSEDPDELSAARSALIQFALLPKSIAGNEVRLSLAVTGDPYPASRMVCRAFNFEFGATVGVPVKVVQPEGVAPRDLSNLFVGAKQAADILPIAKGDQIEGYARLHFSDTELDQMQARFRSRTDYSSSMYGASAIAATMGDPVRYQADSSIAVELSKLIRVNRASKSDA